MIAKWNIISTEKQITAHTSPVKAGILHGYFRIIKDPNGLFKGIFRKYDFAISFDSGNVWAEGTILIDEQNQKYVVQYEPRPGLLRDDNVLFVLNKRMNFKPEEI